MADPAPARPADAPLHQPPPAATLLDDAFLQERLTAHRAGGLPGPRRRRGLARRPARVRLPQLARRRLTTLEALRDEAEALRRGLARLVGECPDAPERAPSLARAFVAELPDLHARLDEDARAILAGDPAAHYSGRGGPHLPRSLRHRRAPRCPRAAGPRRAHARADDRRPRPSQHGHRRAPRRPHRAAPLHRPRHGARHRRDRHPRRRRQALPGRHPRRAQRPQGGRRAQAPSDPREPRGRLRRRHHPRRRDRRRRQRHRRQRLAHALRARRDQAHVPTDDGRGGAWRLSVLDLIGRTPLVELPAFAHRPEVRISPSSRARTPAGASRTGRRWACCAGALERGRCVPATAWSRPPAATPASRWR